MGGKKIGLVFFLWQTRHGKFLIAKHGFTFAQVSLGGGVFW
jgi:hypothetical protein